jgi:hypothetical protein
MQNQSDARLCVNIQGMVSEFSSTKNRMSITRQIGTHDPRCKLGWYLPSNRWSISVSLQPRLIVIIGQSEPRMDHSQHNGNIRYSWLILDTRYSQKHRKSSEMEEFLFIFSTPLSLSVQPSQRVWVRHLYVCAWEVRLYIVIFLFWILDSRWRGVG